MKKLLILASFILVACAQEEAGTESASQQSYVLATAPDFIGESSRTTITPTSTGMSFAWAAGDELAVYGSSESSITNYIIDAESVAQSASTARFTNSDFGLRTGSVYYAVYPGNFAARDPHAYPVTYLGQNQLTNESSAHLSSYDYLTASGTAVAGNLCPFTFKHVGAIVRVKITVDQACNLKDLKITSNGAPFVTKGTVDVTAATPTVTATESSQTVSLALGTNGQGITLPYSNFVLTTYLIVPPVNLSGTTIDISVRANGKKFTKTVSGKNLKAGSASAFSANFTTVVEDTRECVDMGLPSGTRWAKCNIGANEESEYGDLIAWGELDPKAEYSWASYLYCNGAQDELTKYNNSKVYGLVDNVLKLDAEDDAASVNWGPYWTMPTAAQFEELLSDSYTTSTWTTVNGVSGRLFTSKANGNTVFFPATGYEDGGTVTHRGVRGHYWSREVNNSLPYYGKYFYIDNSFKLVNSYYRNIGQAVRAVRSKNY